MIATSFWADLIVHAAILIALLSFIGTQLNSWRTSRNVADQLKHCRERLADLEQTNHALLKEILKINGGGKG